MRALAKHTFVDTCFELARLADADREYSEAIRYWLRILDVDPYDEDAHLGLISSLLAQRRHGEARRAYRHYSAKMAELELEPAPFPTISPCGFPGHAGRCWPLARSALARSHRSRVSSLCILGERRG